MNSTTLSFNPTWNKPQDQDPDESLFGDIEVPSDDFATENQQPQDLNKKEECPQRSASVEKHPIE